MNSPQQRAPVIAIVGRPNVGKSTLFNRLAGKRLAIIEDMPGVTRDRLYAEAEWQGRPYVVIDTGGILFGDEDPLIEQVRVQAQVAMEEADLILFMVDSRDGVNPADEEVANLLRRGNKPVIMLVNKADTPSKWELVRAEFFKLGLGEPFPISSVHGHGIAEILDYALEKTPPVFEEIELPDSVRVAIVGRPNVGKSSLLNAILGEPRSIVSEIPGTTRDAIDTAYQWKGKSMTLVDTAGLKRPGKVQRTLEYYAQLRAERAIERADVALIVIDGKEGLTHGDKRVAQHAHDAGKSMIWVVNKWDLMEPPDGLPRKRTVLKKEFAAALHQDMQAYEHAPLCYVSALKKTGIAPLLETVFEVAEFGSFRVGTGDLNRLLQEAIYMRPYSRKGRTLKVYYATMPQVKPPTVVMFVNDPNLLHFSYQRYLENRLRAQYPYTGTPIRWVAKHAHEKGDK